MFPDEDIHIEEHKIKFKENEFTRHYLHFHDEEKQLHMDVQFHQQHHLHGNIYMPTIMGPFSYMEMECTHAIISLHHRCDGKLLIQGIAFDAKGIGYIEIGERPFRNVIFGINQIPAGKRKVVFFYPLQIFL